MMNKPLVLIIDDVLENLQVLGETLSGAYRVQFATSGEEGLELIQRHLPDLIMLDVMMPGMNGHEVFSMLKVDELTEQIPVIFVTAKNDAKSESEAIHAGAADFIHKPINPEVVRARVRMHLELDRHRKHLERLVLARTQELAAARAEAESANAVKTRFMANVSHEMRTPLQGILGFAEIGCVRATGAEHENFHAYFEKILQSGKRMHSLVESLLTLTEDAWREQAGLDRSELQEIKLHDFVTEIISLMALRAEKRKQHLVLDMQSSVASFFGDPTRLRLVVEHLLANALSYSQPEQSITLRVSDTELSIPRGKRSVPALAFLVLDQGCGIPEGEINAIFEPFYQSTRTATGAGGSGLGLPLSRSIVRRHGGLLELTSRPEGGGAAEMILLIAGKVD
jgi:signal transduction histidine kinase